MLPFDNVAVFSDQVISSIRQWEEPALPPNVEKRFRATLDDMQAEIVRKEILRLHRQTFRGKRVPLTEAGWHMAMTDAHGATFTKLYREASRIARRKQEEAVLPQQIFVEAPNPARLNEIRRQRELAQAALYHASRATP